MKTIAVLAAVFLAGCDADAADPADNSAAEPAAAAVDAATLTDHRLRIEALPAMHLLATADGRNVLALAVSCALPAGASITAIASDGTPYSFAGNAGLAPRWLSHTPDAGERRRLAACVHGVAAPSTGGLGGPLVGSLRRTAPVRI